MAFYAYPSGVPQRYCCKRCLKAAGHQRSLVKNNQRSRQWHRRYMERMRSDPDFAIAEKIRKGERTVTHIEWMTCPRCEVGFYADTHRPRKYCSKECKNRAALSAWNENNAERKRLVDREWQQRNREAVNEYHRRWRQANPEASRRYKDAWRESNPDRFAAYKKRQADRLYGPNPPKVCICGKVFQGTRKQAYCSDLCKARRRAETYGALRRGQTFDARQISSRKDLVEYLRERDQNRCHICRKWVNPRVTTTGRNRNKAASVDHIVPISKGGSDDLSNLALAHLGCNIGKNNRAANDQLRLVG